MGKNTKPMLTVLVEENKLQQFRDYALSKEVSMGWVVNKLLDRVLSGELVVSEDSYSTRNVSTGLSRDEIEEMIRASLENNSTSNLDITDVENLINTYISNLNILDPSGVRELIRESTPPIVKSQIEPLADLITELETYTQNQFKAVREELKRATGDRSVTNTDAIAIPTTPAKTADKDPSVKSWAEFFKMIGMDALTATEAQKKENIDTRTQQIEQGLQVAKEQGLGEWAVKVAGRSFVRVGD